MCNRRSQRWRTLTLPGNELERRALGTCGPGGGCAYDLQNNVNIPIFCSHVHLLSTRTRRCRETKPGKYRRSSFQVDPVVDVLDHVI
jgi:hypothetical protein